MKVKRSLAGMIWAGCAALILLCTGCSNYDFSTDYVQIGCRVQQDSAEKTEISFFRFGFPWWIDSSAHHTLYGIDLSPCLLDQGILNGLGISLISSRATVNGIIVAPIYSIQRKTNGVSLSMINFSMDYCPSMQVGVANFNIAFWVPDGGAAIQLAPLNFAESATAQFGAVNVCYKDYKKEMRNLCQFGLVNSSPNCRIQFGLLNYNENSAFCKWFPLVNFAGTSSGNER